MDLGSPSGSTNRLIQMLFIGGDVEAEMDRIHAYCDKIENDGVAKLLLAAPFFRTVVGTDQYVDQL